METKARGFSFINPAVRAAVCTLAWRLALRLPSILSTLFSSLSVVLVCAAVLSVLLGAVNTVVFMAVQCFHGNKETRKQVERKEREEREGGGRGKGN